MPPQGIKLPEIKSRKAVCKHCKAEWDTSTDAYTIICPLCSRPTPGPTADEATVYY